MRDRAAAARRWRWPRAPRGEANTETSPENGNCAAAAPAGGQDRVHRGVVPEGQDHTDDHDGEPEESPATPSAERAQNTQQQRDNAEVERIEKRIAAAIEREDPRQLGFVLEEGVAEDTRQDRLYEPERVDRPGSYRSPSDHAATHWPPAPWHQLYRRGPPLPQWPRRLARSGALRADDGSGSAHTTRYATSSATVPIIVTGSPESI